MEEGGGRSKEAKKRSGKATRRERVRKNRRQVHWHAEDEGKGGKRKKKKSHRIIAKFLHHQGLLSNFVNGPHTLPLC